MKTFKSDNTASVHPKVMEAIIEANQEHAIPYGDDDITERAVKRIEEIFGGNCHASLVLNGTGANVIGLSSILRPYEAVICPDSAHINCDECGAFERYTGAKLLTVSTEDGKLRPEDIEPFLDALDNEHHSQPRAISITQITELGTLYSIEELKALTSYAHDNGLLVHVDGARIANAAVAIGVSLKEMITDTGIDLLSFGAAKNGLMYGEAIVSFHNSYDSIKFVRKQGMQLMSKMRYIAAQYEAILKDDLWYHNALNANSQMAMLYNGLKQQEGITFLFEPKGNIAFAYLPQNAIDDLEKHNYFYQIKKEGERGLIRLVTSFDTTSEEVKSFLGVVAKVLS